MPRRKHSVDPSTAKAVTAEAATVDVTAAGAVATDPSSATSASSPEGDPAPGVGGEPARRPWRRHLETLAVPAAGVSAGEDRKFAQVYIAFDKERPTDEQKARMTEAGFRYRSAEKRWDAPANPVTRVTAKKLVAEFTGVTLGAAQGR